MYRVFTMAGLANDSMVQLTFTMLMLGIVSTLALTLGAVGLYTVLSCMVAQRTREIGVRMALNAEAGRVRRMVVAQGARGRSRRCDRSRGRVADAFTFVGMSASMIASGLLASYVPARKASRVDPIESLHGE
jgi:putative ABC transport system permease protein